VPIIPLLVGHNNGWKDLQELASVLRDFRSPDDLWVISNDFTHYGKSFGYTPFPARDAEEEIRKIDLHGAELITTGKAEEFFHLARKTTFDGGTSIPLTMLSLAPCEGKLLMHMLSGEQTGSFDHSVSYLAIALNCKAE
jgi:AmmeMemoRadiSam system protein B